MSDAENCFRLLLGREGASGEAESQLADAPDIWTLIERFLQAPEALSQRAFAASTFIQADQDPRKIDFKVTEAQHIELISHIEEVWRRYGQEDAYFSVMTHPSYRADRLTPAGVEHFYQTGAAEFDELRNVFRRNGIEPDPAWSVCELGCGVARVGAAFAREFGGYLGVDISAEHLAIARRHLEVQNLGFARLALLSEFLDSNVTFDLFYSALVLQHNPPPMMDILLDACLERINPGGYACFQLPCHLHHYSFDVASYLTGTGRSDEMEMHALPQHRVFALLAKHGLIPVEVVPDGRVGSIGFSYRFLACKNGQLAQRQ